MIFFTKVKIKLKKSSPKTLSVNRRASHTHRTLSHKHRPMVQQWVIHYLFMVYSFPTIQNPSCGILNTLPTCNADGSPLLGFGLPLGLKPARWADDMRFPPTFRNPTEASLRPDNLEIWALPASYTAQDLRIRCSASRAKRRSALSCILLSYYYYRELNFLSWYRAFPLFFLRPLRASQRWFPSPLSRPASWEMSNSLQKAVRLDSGDRRCGQEEYREIPSRHCGKQVGT